MIRRRARPQDREKYTNNKQRAKPLVDLRFSLFPLDTATNRAVFSYVSVFVIFANAARIARARVSTARLDRCARSYESWDDRRNSPDNFANVADLLYIALLAQRSRLESERFSVGEQS